MKYKIESYKSGYFIRYQAWWMCWWGWIGSGLSRTTPKSWKELEPRYAFNTRERAIEVIDRLVNGPNGKKGRTYHVEVKDAT